MSAHPRWTPEADALLAKLWPAGNRQEIIEAFPDRSWTALVQRAARLRKKRDRSMAQPEWRRRTPASERRRLVFDRVADEVLRTGYGLTRKEIARDVRLHPNTVSHIVADLEKAGLLVRRGDGSRRAICLAPAVRDRLEVQRIAQRRAT